MLALGIFLQLLESNDGYEQVGFLESTASAVSASLISAAILYWLSKERRQNFTGPSLTVTRVLMFVFILAAVVLWFWPNDLSGRWVHEENQDVGADPFTTISQTAAGRVTWQYDTACCSHTFRGWRSLWTGEVVGTMRRRLTSGKECLVDQDVTMVPYGVTSDQILNVTYENAKYVDPKDANDPICRVADQRTFGWTKTD